jgi:tetratricopeptide (TPR) repeat protein
MQDQSSNIADNQDNVSLNVDHRFHLVKKFKSSLIPKNMMLILVLLVLVTALYFVIVWLPNAAVSMSEQGDSSVVTDAKSFIKEKSLQTIDESPWQDAQLAKYRLQAQNILSKVLTKQKRLEDKKVSLWASSAFEESLAQAASGDLFYRNQEFSTAIETYQQALQKFTKIEANITTIFTERLAKGQAAIEANDTHTAKKELQIAMYMQVDNEDVKISFDRALVLDKVIILLQKGKVQQEEQQFSLAKESFVKAAELDPYSTKVKTRLLEINSLIKNDKYAQAMSEGYKALLNNQYDKALLSFTKALKIFPDSIDTKQAIKQSHNEKTQTALAKHIKQGQVFELQEQWQSALATYNQALLLDQSLIAAKVGMIRTQARLNFDHQLQNIIDKPDRLMEANVFAQANQHYKSALQINYAGKRLLQQITKIDQLLTLFVNPLPLTIESDNQTNISLQRNGTLGRFMAKELVLKPGKYTFIGTRDGYRDVIKKVMLMPEGENKNVTIQCIERVGRG